MVQKYENKTSSSNKTIIFENKTLEYIKTLGFNEDRVSQMMQSVKNEKIDITKLDNLTNSGYQKKEALLAQLFKKNEKDEFFIEDETKKTFANYLTLKVVPDLVVLPSISTKTEEWLKKSAGLNKNEVIKAMESLNKYENNLEKNYDSNTLTAAYLILEGKGKMNEKTIKQYWLSLHGDVATKAYALREQKKNQNNKIMAKSNEKAKKIEEIKTEKEVANLTVEAEIELTLFEKFYGPQANPETRKKIFADAWESKSKEKKQEETVETKKLFDVAEMKKDSRENEKVEKPRQRKGETQEKSEKIVKEKKVEKKAEKKEEKKKDKKEEEIDLSDW